MWILFSIASALFAGITSILAKCGIKNTDSDVATAIRTVVVLIMAWVLVFVTKKTNRVKDIPKKELGFICLSGIATGASWLCYYRALQTGPASAVVPIDKLSILVTIVFSYIVFKETLSKKALLGLGGIVAGTMILIIK